MQPLLETILENPILYTAAGTVVAALIIGSVTAPGRIIARRVQERLRRRAAGLAAPRIERLDEPLLPRPAPVRGLAVRILRACNAEAADLYREKMAGRVGTPRQLEIWGYTFDDEAWTGQRAFIEPRYDGGEVEGEPVTAYVRRILDGPEPRGSRRAWIRGAAGAGKTTLMTRLYFELIGAVDDLSGSAARRRGDGRARRRQLNAGDEPAGAVPMLVQPRNLTRNPVRELSAPPEGRTWFEVFVATWLANRGIKLPDHLIGPLAADLEVALDDGEVVLMLDGYDELHRMGLQRQASTLLRFPIILGADRSDEEREKPKNAVVLRLPPQWPPELWEPYLRRRWSSPERQAWVQPVRERIAAPDAAWLRNPRILAFLAEVLESPHGFTIESLHTLTRGEFELLDRVFDAALKRIQDLGGEMAGVRKQQVADRLARVAVEQFHGGTCLPPDDQQPDEGWQIVRQMTEIVTATEAGVRIDHPVFRDFFLARRVADELRLNRLPSIERRWSRTTLASASAILRELDERADELVWSQLESPRLLLPPDAPPGATAASPLAINLLDLAIRMAGDRVRSAAPALGRLSIRRRIRIQDRRLADLDLRRADFESLTFERCVFDGSNLSDANMKDAVFTDCSFVGAELTRSDAYAATFRGCTFTGPDAAPLRVAGMETAEATWEDGTDVDPEALLAAGAAAIRSRYRAGFFSRHQSWLLGEEGYIRLEIEYLRQIREAVRRFPADSPVYMIDLMAGGSNERLIQLLRPDTPGGGDLDGSSDDLSLPNLRVLALDRDTRQLDALGLSPDRLRTWQVELHGGADAGGKPLPRAGNIVEGIDLAGALARFDGSPRGAHVIIAKKAIHEIPRTLQPLLLSQCVDTLVAGGSLILFADSPGDMSGDGRRRLEEMRSLLVGEDTEPDRLRRLVRAEAIERQTFADSPADIALFCNMWIMLKDWANDNRHEYANRYFSSRTEILEWVGGDPRMRLRDEVPGTYRLAPARFNEGAVREIIAHLDDHPDAIDEARSMIRNRLLSPERDRLHLLADFTYHHLLDPSGRPTALGAALGAGTDRVRFDRLHERLRGRRPDSDEDRFEAVAFDFPVHILVFERTAE